MKRWKFSPFPHSTTALIIVAAALVICSYLLPVDEAQEAVRLTPETTAGQTAAEATQKANGSLDQNLQDEQENINGVPGDAAGADSGTTGQQETEEPQPAAKVEIIEDGTWSRQVPSEEQAVGAEEPPTSFEEYRLQRTKNHAATKEVLEAIIQDPETTEEMRTQAQQDMVALSKVTEQELTVENLLQLRYGGEAVVFIGGEQATAVLRTDQPPAEQGMALAAQLVADYTGLAFENIVVLVMD